MIAPPPCLRSRCRYQVLCSLSLGGFIRAVGFVQFGCVSQEVRWKPLHAVGAAQLLLL